MQQVAIYQAGGPASEPFLIPEWVSKGRDENGAQGQQWNHARSGARQQPSRNSQTAPVSRRLLVSVRETEDEAADRERLAGLMAALVDFPGEDEVRLVVHTRVGDKVELALPRPKPAKSFASGWRRCCREPGRLVSTSRGAANRSPFPDRFRGTSVFGGAILALRERRYLRRNRLSVINQLA